MTFARPFDTDLATSTSLIFSRVGERASLTPGAGDDDAVGPARDQVVDVLLLTSSHFTSPS